MSVFSLCTVCAKSVYPKEENGNMHKKHKRRTFLMSNFLRLSCQLTRCKKKKNTAI